MTYVPRNFDAMPWVANNGLRVEKRTSHGFWLTWSSDMTPKSNVPSASTSQEDSRGVVDQVDGGGVSPVDGLEGPWFEIQIKKDQDDSWATIYRGYRERIEVKDLAPDAIVYFRMKRNGENVWGSTIIAATDCVPPYAEDIHRAVTCNAEDMVLRIIGSSKGVRLRKMLQSHDANGMTPLMIACQNGNYSIAELLLQAGSWVNIPSFTTKRTALMFAASCGNVRLLELLDKAAVDWSATDKTGCNAFHHAINADKLPSLKYAVARCGIKIITQPDNLGWSPLLRAVIVGAPLGTLNFLLSKGADPNAVDKTKTKSCLIAAAMVGERDICELLLSVGADPTFKNCFGKTAYDIATSRNDQEIANSIEKSLTALACPLEKKYPKNRTHAWVVPTPDY